VVTEFVLMSNTRIALFPVSAMKKTPEMKEETLLVEYTINQNNPH
jgi:hypothetical protein